LPHSTTGVYTTRRARVYAAANLEPFTGL
jgi:hypothetical protein